MTSGDSANGLSEGLPEFAATSGSRIQRSSAPEKDTATSLRERCLRRRRTQPQQYRPVVQELWNFTIQLLAEDRQM